MGVSAPEGGANLPSRVFDYCLEYGGYQPTFKLDVVLYGVNPRAKRHQP